MSIRKTRSVAQTESDHQILDDGLWFGKHVVAIVAGFVLTVAGLGMGVTMVLLPIGIPVGLVGVMMLIWGLTEWTRN
jgi:hypothetical protein